LVRRPHRFAGGPGLVKFSDTVWGTLLLALALAVLWNVRSFPLIPGQKIGPAAFPTLLAVILAGCALALIWRGWRARASHAVMGDWLRSPRHVGNFVLTVVVLLFYIFAANRLGFLVCAPLILLVLFLKLGVKPALAVLIAIVAAFAIHLIFYKMLRVALPWGIVPVLY
jgi:putative tricarboxylic transport membrane protein